MVALKIAASPERNTPAWRKRVLLEARKTTFVAASKRHRIARSALYRFDKRVRGRPEEEWEALLADQRRGPKSNQPKVVRRQEQRAAVVLKASTEHPAAGCNRIQALLRERGVRTSHQTIQNILTDAGRGSRHERWLALDLPGVKFSKAQLEFAETMNPALQDRTQSGEYPGAVLFIDRVVLARDIPGQRNVHLYVAIDSCSSRALCTLARPSASNQWVKFLEQFVLPWLDDRNTRGRRPVLEIREGILAKELGEVKLLLKKKKIELTRWRHMRGGVQRFVTAVGRQFKVSEHAREPFATIDEARDAFKLWQRDYNRAGVDGFPNFGKSPFQIVQNGARVSPKV